MGIFYLEAKISTSFLLTVILFDYRYNPVVYFVLFMIHFPVCKIFADFLTLYNTVVFSFALLLKHTQSLLSSRLLPGLFFSLV